MSDNTLPRDVCRCMDDGCPEREDCLRWLDRHAQGQRVSKCASLFPYDIPISEPCPMRIPREAE